ncbi:MAG: VacJ family lipoprotein [Gammaproteobacteria bacterium]|uniref:MlaA family lipoprotein n=1 Tax=Pseudomaricurvus alcaniphilus TaxID=1166482 RepID=UPI00140CEBE5|nr:VacJ family lipoprotein [Pseudomaricurvus alcaniphilus]MBR9912402.1 VacJ family lipoprotein [Gammaproteobacteria bacterium]NHN36765.1 VacJ family lipoprotein [Pseudomaricurvus alcaniphilus]
MLLKSLQKYTLVGMAVAVFGVAQAASGSEQDPWEGFNRKVFAFNDTIDRYLVKPLAKGYKAITPDPLETGITNFFDNLLEVRNIVNDLLQGKLGQAGNDGGRLLINSTVGIAGFFDVAKHWGLPENSGEDFGQTLAGWGTGQGPYMMLPLLGPSTLRDTFGMPFDGFLSPVQYVDDVPTRNTIHGVSLLDKRASLLDAESLANGDRYVFLREAYLQRRNYLINDGQVADDFESEEDF